MAKKFDDTLNSLSEVLLQALANRPDLLAKITTHKGIAAGAAVPGKRITMKERRNNIRERFYSLSAKQEKA